VSFANELREAGQLTRSTHIKDRSQCLHPGAGRLIDWRSLSDSPLDKSRRLSQQTEIHGHGENKSLGLSVQQKWCVLPLAHRVDRRACEKLDRAKYGEPLRPVRRVRRLPPESRDLRLPRWRQAADRLARLASPTPVPESHRQCGSARPGQAVDGGNGNGEASDDPAQHTSRHPVLDPTSHAVDGTPVLLINGDDISVGGWTGCRDFARLKHLRRTNIGARPSRRHHLRSGRCRRRWWRRWRGHHECRDRVRQRRNKSLAMSSGTATAAVPNTCAAQEIASGIARRPMMFRCALTTASNIGFSVAP
jgi:hypothetical protein